MRVGNYVAVAGTTAIKDGAPFAPGDAAAQTRYILEVIERALTEAGATMSDVIRYRVFLTDIADAEAVGNEMGRVFGAIRPAGTHGRQQHPGQPGPARRDRGRRDRGQRHTETGERPRKSTWTRQSRDSSDLLPSMRQPHTR